MQFLILSTQHSPAAPNHCSPPAMSCFSAVCGSGAGLGLWRVSHGESDGENDKEGKAKRERKKNNKEEKERAKVWKTERVND